MPYKDFEAVKRTAMKVDQISAERDRALARVKNQIRELMLQKLTDSLK